MKKIISFVLVLTMCVALALSLASCDLVHPIQRFLLNMQNEKSYKITAAVDAVPGFGSFGSLEIVTSVDGNVQHVDAGLLGEAYIEEVDGVRYGYYKNLLGGWNKQQLDVEEIEIELQDVFGPDLIFAIFNPENYDEVEGEENTYKQKADVEFTVYEGVNVENVVITVNDDICTVSLTVSIDGYGVEAELVVSDVGSTSVELPSVN